jgi:hypothetical protein
VAATQLGGGELLALRRRHGTHVLGVFMARPLSAVQPTGCCLERERAAACDALDTAPSHPASL